MKRPSRSPWPELSAASARRAAWRTGAAAVALALSGCFHAGYLAQATAGQLSMLHAARKVQVVLRDEAVPRRTRFLLAQVKGIKAWGQARGLEPTTNYDHYADLHRAAAVWVVQACAPLEFKVRRWDFPIVGSVPYLGYFDPEAARRKAAQLARDEGLDVEVRTAAAYSTLGWFSDPVLSTMLPSGDEALGELAETILHESLHATLYLPHQSAFDESLASFVGEGLAQQWLAERVGADSPRARAYQQSLARSRAFGARFHQAYDALDALYRSAVSVEEKREGKARQLEALQRELGLRRTPNNASLAGSRAYDTGRAGFERLLAACGDWPRFLAAVRTLSATDFRSPQQEEFDGVLHRLALRACPGPASR